MSLLVETIRVEDGNLINVRYHNERMISSLRDLFNSSREIDLKKLIQVPDFAGKGIFKCRIEFDTEIRKIEFIPYMIKPVRSLKLVEDNDIDYRYKFADRNAIERLMEKRGDCDDIIIIKNGYLTDSSYANLVFLNRSGKWLTPSLYLLPGTRRARLLTEGKITETPISVSDLKSYKVVRLINAMIGICDTQGIPVRNIKW